MDDLPAGGRVVSRCKGQHKDLGGSSLGSWVSGTVDREVGGRDAERAHSGHLVYWHVSALSLPVGSEQREGLFAAASTTSTYTYAGFGSRPVHRSTASRKQRPAACWLTPGSRGRRREAPGSRNYEISGPSVRGGRGCWPAGRDAALRRNSSVYLGVVYEVAFGDAG